MAGVGSDQGHWNLSSLKTWCPPFGVWTNLENEKIDGERCSQQPVVAAGSMSEVILDHC